MFGIFIKKNYLKDCLPNGYVDIHSHTLPSIDDGAKTIANTKFLLKSMIDLGFEKVITTPHTIAQLYPNTSEGIIESYNEKIKEATSTYKEAIVSGSSVKSSPFSSS